MTVVSVRSTTFPDIAALRERHRREADVQIVRDSILPRGLAEPFAIESGGDLMGYAGVWTEHYPGRVMEYFLIPEARAMASEAFRAMLEASGAREIEAQTNLPQLHAMLLRYAVDVSDETVLFGDGPSTRCLSAPGVRFRPRRAEDEGPRGEWVLVRGRRVVAAGGFLDHYNPPYCDVYLEVVADERGQGLGSYLAQELRHESRSVGFRPAARCDVDNEASWRALARGGFVECGRIVAGRVRPAWGGDA